MTPDLPAVIASDLQRVIDLARAIAGSGALPSAIAPADPPVAVSQAASLLYANWYTAPAASTPLSVLPGRDDLVPSLRSAVTASSRFSRGWVVMQTAPTGVCVAGLGGRARTLQPGDYVNESRPGLPVMPGDAVAVTERVDWVDPATGFWCLESAAGEPDEPLVRVYWNTGPDHVACVLGALTTALDARAGKYRLKCPARAAEYARVDAVVVYLHKGEWRRLRRLIGAVALALKPHLRDGRPPLTLSVARGVGVADDPSPVEASGGRESFGENRCRALAPTFLALAARGSEQWPSQLDALTLLANALRAVGIDPQRPWQNADSQASPAAVSPDGGSARDRSP